jgi:hypothetical protein
MHDVSQASMASAPTMSINASNYNPDNVTLLSANIITPTASKTLPDETKDEPPTPPSTRLVNESQLPI